MGILNKISSRLEYHKRIYMKRQIDAKSGKTVNWAIMGLGHMANTFARALNTTPGAKIVAAASRSQQKSEDFAKKYKIPHAYDNYEIMLKDDSIHIDIVYISTPVFCHYENIKMALINNMNVLCEKPIVMDIEQLKELQELAAQKNLFLTEGMWMLYLPTMKKAQEWLSDGIIGDVKGIRADLSKREVIDYTNSKYSSKAGSGVLLDYGIYPVAFAANFMGESLSVKYSSSLTHSKGFDQDWVIILNDDNKDAVITVSSDFDGSRRAVIFGDKGSISWNAQFNRTDTISCYNSEGALIDSFHADYQAGGLEFEIDEVQECLLCGKTETCSASISMSLKVISLIEQIRQMQM